MIEKPQTIIEKTYRTHKGTISYWVNPPQDSPITLIFLPGLTADHHLFDQQIAYFEKRMNVLVWDAPGHAASRPFQLTFTLMDKARWLHEIILKEQIAHPVFVGQSMGGYVSQCYMQAYPGTIDGFISIDSAPLQRQYVTTAEIWLLCHCTHVYQNYPWKTLKRQGAKGCSETEYGRSLMTSMIETYTHRAYATLAGHGYKMLGEAMLADLPYSIDCPALLICGEKDHAGSTKRYNRAWHKRSGIPLVWIVNAGHNSNTDAPDQINTLIEGFVNERLTTSLQA